MTKRILVYVGGDLLGDAIMKLPFLMALKQAYPDAHITYLSRKKTCFANLLKPFSHGLIDTVISDLNYETGLKQLLHNPFKNTPLENANFDLIIDTQKRWQQTLLLKKISHQQFISGCAGFLFSDKRPPRHHRSASAMTKRLIELVEIVSGKTLDKNPHFTIDAHHRALAKKILDAKAPYIGFAPGGRDPKKHWPIEHYIALALKQVVKKRIPVFFLGPMETDYIAPIRQALPTACLPDTCQNNDPQTSGPLLAAALAERLSGLVGNDCGTAHLLSIGKPPTVLLFGPTNSEKFLGFSTEKKRCLSIREHGLKDLAALSVEAVEQALELQLTEMAHKPKVSTTT